MQDDIRRADANSGTPKLTPNNSNDFEDTSGSEAAIESFSDEPVEATSIAIPSEEPSSADSVLASATASYAATEQSTFHDESSVETGAVDDTGDEPKQRFKLSWPPTKKQALIIATVVLVLGVGGAAAYSVTSRDAKPLATTTAKKKAVVTPPVPTTVPAKLTGLTVDPAVNQRPVTGVMIENSPDARPQSGLDQAGVVFEAVAEGGVTRFFALFQDTQPDYIGPVRSARPYYVQWCLSFDCSYAHVGGSPDGLAGIKSWGVKDLDQFANSGAYHRISSRYAPHNVYTSIAELNSLEAAKGIGVSNYTGFSRKADQLYKAPDPAATGKAAKAQDTRAPVNSMDFTLSGYYYDPHFEYDAVTNTYKRSEAGQPHMELHQDGTQTQIAPKVVIGMIVSLSAGALDAQGSAYSNYQAVGTGDALVFQDGTVTKIHWSKPDIKSALSFTDDTGKPFKLNAGQTWVTAITGADKASYK
ncbi:DUF3048 domain-containing protein [Aeromicrobium sp.]|nr:DUF3048 domain-containing protein [Candidatus Saccharibacteria bacterium]